MRKGAIFRGQRMVNWSPVLQTAVSDLEAPRLGWRSAEISSLVDPGQLGWSWLILVDPGQVEYSDVQGQLYYFKQNPQASAKGCTILDARKLWGMLLLVKMVKQRRMHFGILGLIASSSYTRYIWLYSSNFIPQGHPRPSKVSRGVTWCHFTGWFQDFQAFCVAGIHPRRHN